MLRIMLGDLLDKSVYGNCGRLKFSIRFTLEAVVFRVNAEYDGLKSKADGELQAATVAVNTFVKQIAQHDSQHEPVDLTGTDELGCLVAASIVLRSFPAYEKYLVM